MVAGKSKLNTGRTNQKHRTRNDLLQAAAELMRQGRVPSIEEVAEAAHVSRATAYRYFPTNEHILAGTIVLKANLDGETRLESAITSNDPATRLDGVVQEFHTRFSTNEVAYRALLRLLLQPPDQDANHEERPQVRASRQVHWIYVALTPIQPQISEEKFERLAAALIGATSMEAFIALRDVCQLDATEAGRVMRWTAQTLLKATLAE